MPPVPARAAGLGAALVLLTALLAACGSGEDEPTARTSTSSSSAAPDAMTPEQEDLAAKIAAGAPPKDLSWRYEKPPANWKELSGDTTTGVHRWQIGSTACAVLLLQPSGLGTAKVTSADAARKVATDVASGSGLATPRVTSSSSRLLPNVVQAADTRSATRAATLQLDFGAGTRGYAIGYRDGDFALQFLALCGRDQLGQVEGQVEAFVKGLSAVTTY